MDHDALRYLLIVDRAALENTPAEEIRPAVVQRWCLRARRLAEMEGRDSQVVINELRDEAGRMAVRQRQDALNELARDLAVSRALGRPLGPPWQRRLQYLVHITEQPVQALTEQVEQLAAQVEVVISA